MAIRLERRPLTVEEYHRMAEAGILGEDDKVELLNGQIIKMSPIASPAGLTFSLFSFSRAGPGGAIKDEKLSSKG